MVSLNPKRLKVRKKMLEYENRLGKVYHIRAKKTKLGKTTYVASAKSSPDDIEKIPRGYEIYENADGQVFCRRKLVTNILPSEVACLKEWKRKLEDKRQARVYLDVKADEVIVHSSQHPCVVEARLGALFGFPKMRSGSGRERELFVHYQCNLKFVLDDSESREYSVYRMCYRGEGGWMLLDFGPLDVLAKKTMPHLELDSFYELM